MQYLFCFNHFFLLRNIAKSIFVLFSYLLDDFINPVPSQFERGNFCLEIIKFEAFFAMMGRL